MRRVLLFVSLLLLTACNPNPLTAEILFKHKRAEFDRAAVAVRACGESGKMVLHSRKDASGCKAAQGVANRIRDDLGAEVIALYWSPDGVDFVLRAWDFENPPAIHYWPTAITKAKHKLGRSPTHWTFEQ
ncbi:MAG: hypothetical protein JWR84_1889 [Caulobacter sp.]|nr:hypothetical protein [Caulobacter sp.]